MKDKTNSKVHIKKNDQVTVISGRELGKKGKVLKVFRSKSRAIVEGVNFIKKAQRPSQRNQKGGIIEKEGTIHVSNLKVICTRCNKPTRIGHSRLDDGSNVRVCKKCGEFLEK